MIAQQSALWMYNPNQQEINELEFFLLLEKVLGRKIRDADKKWFAGCATVEAFIYRLLESEVFQALALRNNLTTQANLVEFYVCLRCGLKWDPRPGFDLWGALEHQKEIKAGKIEVKHGGDVRHYQWCVQITGKEKILRADVLVFVGMPEEFNPCEGKMFVIPAQALAGEVERQLERSPGRIPEIYVNKNRQNNNTKKQNKWYEYELIEHISLKDQLSKYIHGAPVVLSHQYSLFKL